MNLVAIALAGLGTPLFIVVSFLALHSFYSIDIDLTVLFIEMYRLAETPSLTAIPFFTFSGFLLAHSNAPNRLVALSSSLLGWLPSGLAIVALFICAFFTALTGASGVTIIALGGLLYPSLKKAQYDEHFSLGLLTTSGSLGLLFPPSLPLILYGIIASVPIDQLFLAGLIPGLLLLLVLSLYSIVKMPAKKEFCRPVNKQPIWPLVRDSIWEIGIPFILVGGIFSGLIALSESAVLCTVYLLLVEVVLKKEIPLKALPNIIVKSMGILGAIYIILGSSMAYTNYLIDQQIPNALLSFIQLHIDSKWILLIALNLFLLAVGCLVDMFSALILVIPLVLPLAQAYEIHPIHLGIIFLTNLEIGYSTPPIGLNLFIASLRFKKPIFHLYRASIPFLALLFVCLLLITYIPALSLVLITS